MGADWSQYNERRKKRLGSTDEFRRWLEREHEDLLVPEDEIVLECGSVGWTPEDERIPGPGEVCPKCLNEAKPDESARCCPRCLRSAFDRHLEAQRMIADELEGKGDDGQCS